MLQIEFLDLAQNELDDTFDYYEYQQKNLGYRFVQEIFNTINLIKLYPYAWTKSSQNTLRCLLNSFPYGVIYQKRENIILIIAIINLHRKPNYWAGRI